jgi:hypothetical protein
VDGPCKQCHFNYQLDVLTKKCHLRPYLTIEGSKDFDFTKNECVSCEDGLVLDVDESPFCAWNKQRLTLDPTHETSVKFWGKFKII